MQCRLRHADMRLDADDDKGIPFQLAQPLGKGTGLKTVKFQFYDRLNVLQFLMKTGYRLPKVLLFRAKDRQPDNMRELDKPEGILNYLLLIRDDGDESFLHIDDYKESIIPSEYGVSRWMFCLHVQSLLPDQSPDGAFYRTQHGSWGY